MYYLTPFRYLLDGLLSVAVHDRPVICEESEFARFSAPPGETCGSYTQAFITQAGGYVQTGVNGICEFCQYRNGNEFAAGFNIDYANRWQSFGIFAAFCVFNFIVVFVASWLFLGGTKTISQMFHAKARKQEKELQQQGNEKA